MQTELIRAINNRLKQLRVEIEQLEGARQSLTSDGHPQRRRSRGRTRPRATRPSRNGRRSSRRSSRTRQPRMDQRERQAQALNRIREHGAEGVTVTALAQEMGVTRSYLYGRILPPLKSEITRTRGRVAPKA
jgi:hypothetical protein